MDPTVAYIATLFPPQHASPSRSTFLRTSTTSNIVKVTQGLASVTSTRASLRLRSGGLRDAWLWHLWHPRASRRGASSQFQRKQGERRGTEGHVRRVSPAVTAAGYGALRVVSMSGLATYVTQRVLMLTQDGRVIVGKLEGFDSQGSIILSECVERIFSADEGVVEDPIGLYIVRGDSIALVGELDAEKDASVDWNTVQADPVPEIRHK